MQIPGYEVGEEIGHGGFSRVNKAIQKFNDESVAVKTALEGFEGKIKDEFEIYKKLGKHPHIAELKGGDPDFQIPYIILEAVESNLKIKLPQLDQKQKVQVAHQALEALVHAQERGVVHKDIKPSNIMLTSDNQVKLIDFGLAQNKEDLDLSFEKSQRNGIEGSFFYMAPEVMDGQEATHQSDIFSFGAVLYEIFIGQKLRSGSHKSTGNKELDKVLFKATETKPEERYQSFSDFKLDLEKAVKGSAVSLAVEAKPNVTEKKEQNLQGIFDVSKKNTFLDGELEKTSIKKEVYLINDTPNPFKIPNLNLTVQPKEKVKISLEDYESSTYLKKAVDSNWIRIVADGDETVKEAHYKEKQKNNYQPPEKPSIPKTLKYIGIVALVTAVFTAGGILIAPKLLPTKKSLLQTINDDYDRRKRSRPQAQTEPQRTSKPVLDTTVTYTGSQTLYIDFEKEQTIVGCGEENATSQGADVLCHGGWYDDGSRKQLWIDNAKSGSKFFLPKGEKLSSEQVELINYRSPHGLRSIFLHLNESVGVKTNQGNKYKVTFSGFKDTNPSEWEYNPILKVQKMN
ncbi:MAG: serine/threonine protein kinase [Nanoarchaeota archaeon]|nr:serine/threonine protein kinase [Nanoarchaeota archaeon]